MYKKFGKNRSVDSHWLDIPVKYMLEIKGSSTVGKDKYVLTDEILKEEYEKYVRFMKGFDFEPESFEDYKKSIENDEDFLYRYGKYMPSKHDKDFCIVELHKHSAICAWRNTNTCKIGMTFKCRVKHKKDGTVGIIYKDKFYPINKSTSGWVF